MTNLEALHFEKSNLVREDTTVLNAVYSRMLSSCLSELKDLGVQGHKSLFDEFQEKVSAFQKSSQNPVESPVSRSPNNLFKKQGIQDYKSLTVAEDEMNTSSTLKLMKARRGKRPTTTFLRRLHSFLPRMKR